MRSEGERFTKNESGGPWQAGGCGGSRVVCDLLGSQDWGAGRIKMALMIPLHGASDGLLKIPYGLPLKQVPGFVGGEIEQSGLMHGIWV